MALLHPSPPLCSLTPFFKAHLALLPSRIPASIWEEVHRIYFIRVLSYAVCLRSQLSQSGIYRLLDCFYVCDVGIPWCFSFSVLLTDGQNRGHHSHPQESKHLEVKTGTCYLLYSIQCGACTHATLWRDEACLYWREVSLSWQKQRAVHGCKGLVLSCSHIFVVLCPFRLG